MTDDAYLAGHGDPSYDVLHYDLVLDYRLEGNQLSARARVDAVALEDLSEFALDLDSLKASKVSITGVGGSKHASRRGRLVVTPSSVIEAGREFSVLVTYGGNPRPIKATAGEAGWEELADGVIVAGQPGGAPSWFPCNDRPSSKATYRITITAPTDYLVVANGERVERRQKASTTTWVYEQRSPMASYLATVQIGRYVETSLSDVPVKQRAFVPKGLEKRLGDAFGRQPEMMQLFTRTFGPYPFHDYSVVVTADELEIPLEAQGLSIFGSNFLGSDWETVRLVAHELAHQWFGNSLTLGSWRDIWLHEGFACYAEWLWSEESGGPAAASLARDHHRRLRSTAQDIVIGDPGPQRMFDDRVYKRGALTLQAIRDSIGDGRFFAMLRGWVDAGAHGTVSTEAFVAFATEHTGVDLAPLCDAWLFDQALPDLP